MSRPATVRALLAAMIVSAAAPVVVSNAQLTVPCGRGGWPFCELNRFTAVAGEEQTDLGRWSRVDGLDVTWDVVDYRPSGGTVVLQRRASSDSLLVRDWIARRAESFEATTVGIAMLDTDGSPSVRWSFTGVYPVKWQIGSDADGSEVAIETLVLTYETLEAVRVSR